MAQQYDEIVSALDFKVNQLEKKYVDTYFCNIAMLRILTLITLLSGIIMTINKIQGGSLVCCVGLVLTVLFTSYRKKFKNRIKDILNSDCDSEKAVSWYLSLAAHSKKKSVWELNLYNIGVSLFYAGRFEDAKKMIELFPKLCNSSLGDGLCGVLSMRLTYQEENLDVIKEQYDALISLINDKKLNNMINFREILQYPKWLELSVGEEYEKLYEELKKGFFGNGVLAQVKKNYALYKIAKKLELKEAETYKDYVLKNGGTTFYKKELS